MDSEQLGFLPELGPGGCGGGDTAEKPGELSGSITGLRLLALNTSWSCRRDAHRNRSHSVPVGKVPFAISILTDREHQTARKSPI